MITRGGGGGGQFAPKGLYWQDLSGGALDVATNLIYMVSEDFFSIIHVAILIPGCGHFDPTTLIGRIYVGVY